jgi:hypothetical protein
MREERLQRVVMALTESGTMTELKSRISPPEKPELDGSEPQFPASIEDIR